jgi:DeoR family transcriptional regulator of aga operon
MTRAQRLARIIDLLGERGDIAVEDLVEQLGVSPATARRDLDALAQQQLLTRTRGGAVAHGVAYELPLRYRNQQHPTEKQRIARAASALVETGAVVGLSGGTTTSLIASALGARLDLAADTGGVPSVTIVTNAVNIAAELASRPHVKVVLTGGVLNPRTYEAVGGLAEQVLRSLTLDIAFIGAAALHPVTGATTHDEREADVNRLMAHRARRAILTVDSSKLGREAFAVIGGAAAFPTVLTDPRITREQRDDLVAQGYEVLVAE